MSWDIGDTCYVRMPESKVSVPVYSDNIIFATGKTVYRSDTPMPGSGACESKGVGEVREAGRACITSAAGEAALISKGGSDRVCNYNDAYQRFVCNTYEVAKAMKSGGGTGVVSTHDKKRRRHNGDGAMNIDYIYTSLPLSGTLTEITSNQMFCIKKIN